MGCTSFAVLALQGVLVVVVNVSVDCWNACSGIGANGWTKRWAFLAVVDDHQEMILISVKRFDQLGKARFCHFAGGTGLALAYCPCQPEPGSGCAQHQICSKDQGDNQNEGRMKPCSSLCVLTFITIFMQLCM